MTGERQGTQQSSSRTFLVLQDNLPEHFAVQQHYASGPGTRQALPPYLHSFQHSTSTPQLDQAPHGPADTRWTSTYSLCLHCSPGRECSSFLSSSSPSIKANCNSTTFQTVLSFGLFTHSSLFSPGDSCTWCLTSSVLVLMFYVHAVY